MQVETVDVSGLPEQVVEHIRSLVLSIRKNLANTAGSARKPGPSKLSLPRWDGTVIESLSRRELYDDVG